MATATPRNLRQGGEYEAIVPDTQFIAIFKLPRTRYVQRSRVTHFVITGRRLRPFREMQRSRKGQPEGYLLDSVPGFLGVFAANDQEGLRTILGDRHDLPRVTVRITD